MEFKPKTKHASSAQRIIRSKSVSTVPSNRKQQVQIQNILRSTGAQAKLTIGQPNDKYEQEADRVADQVMHMSDADVAQRVETGTVQPMRIQRMCPECEDEMAKRQPMEEEEEVLQTKEMLGQTPHLGSGVESRIANMKGGGQSLDQTTRAFFEPRFGADFSNVRIHSDIRAVNVAQSTNARAFTLGQDIIFGAGEYLPNELPGRKLLAHELTHVVQQRGGQRHIQRDLAIEPENLQAGVFGLLDPPQVSAALHYNLDRFANSEELRVIRDVLGLETDVYHLVDEEFVQAVASWQASHSLTNVDGKLGPDTVGSLVAEYRAEARLAPTMTPHADRLAIRTRPNERANGIDVNGHSDLFDAILSHQNAQLTLKMRIDFKFYAGSGGSALNAADQNVFIQRFTQDVYRRWSEVYALVPSGNVPNNYLDTYFAKINIEKSSSSPHYAAHIGNTTIAS